MQSLLNVCMVGILPAVSLQCYKGPKCHCDVTPSGHLSPSTVGPTTTASATVYEARVRSCATCTVNGREEQLWSSYSPPMSYTWKVEEKSAKVKEEEDVKKSEKNVGTSGAGKTLVSGWTVGVLLFIVVALLTVVVALVLGQMTVV